MRLNKKQQIDITQLIQKSCKASPIVFENGIFEFFNLNKASQDTIINKLKNVLFINEVYSKKTKDNNYNIIGMLTEQLLKKSIEEDIEIHDNLNPKIWTSDHELLPEIEEKINAIVDTFIKQLKEDDVKIIVDDIYLIGSNANYNYTDTSDLDIHIIADESFDCKSEHLPLIYNAYKTLFNKNYDISINSINVEIYVENKDKLSNTSAGVYSLKKGWINEPAKYNIPEIDKAEFEKQLQKHEKEYLDIMDNPSVESVEAFIDKLYQLRITSIQKDGEFGLGNLIFKEFRHLGYLDELKDLKTELISKKLSL